MEPAVFLLTMMCTFLKLKRAAPCHALGIMGRLRLGAPLGFASGNLPTLSTMSRHILPESQIHPAVRDKVSRHHRDIVDEVQAAARAHAVLVIGMGMNPMPRKARKLLAAAGIAHHYLEYGSYLNQWRKRNALKLWTGWPTFPMVFVKGQLVGGADDVQRLIESGELKRLLG